MSDILVAQSYFLKFDPKEWKTMKPYPPLGAMYGVSVLREAGYNARLFDCMLAEDETEFLAALEREKPQYVVVYDDDFNYLTKMCLLRMREAAFKLAKYAKKHGCTTIIHSSDATDRLELYLDSGFDYVIIGEAEFTLRELIGELTGHAPHPIPEINGLAYRRTEKTVRNAPRKVADDLDVFPFPAWDQVDIEKYRQKWLAHHGYFSLNLTTTRGCPFHCNWCAKPLYGQVYHSRSPQNVVDEIKMLKEKYQPDHIWFADDIFGLRPNWIQEYSDLAKAQGAVIPFKCLSRADLLLRKDTIPKLKQAGCEIVWIGAESGSQKILDAMDKGTTVAQIYEATQKIHETGFRIAFFLQFGYPGELREDIDKTIRMVKECQPDEIGISVSYPLPGTPFYESVKEQLGDKQNWEDSEDLAMLFQGAYVPDFYRILHKVVHKELRLLQCKNALTHLFHELNPQTVKSVLGYPIHLLQLLRYRQQLEQLEKVPTAVYWK